MRGKHVKDPNALFQGPEVKLISAISRAPRASCVSCVRYNMARPTAKLSDAMINVLMTEGLSGSSARAKSPEIMMAAHKHVSAEADPPAKMNAMCTQA